MTRFFLKVLIIILSVSCTIGDNKDIIRKTLNDLGFNKDWEELISLQQEVAFAGATAKISRLEKTMMEVAVIDHMLSLLEDLIDICKRNANARAAAKLVKNLPEAAIPDHLIKARDNTINGFELDIAEKDIRKFKFVYRHLMAAFENIKESDNKDVALFKKSLREYGIDSNQVAALAGATLNSDLSKKIRNESLGRKVNWNDKEKVIAALKFWNIDEPNVVAVAKALHDLRTIWMTSE